MPTTSGPRPSVAVVGSGVSGLTAAHLLSRAYQVTLFESEDRLGGHAHTHEVVDAAGRRHSVDSGFIVHNDRTYPLLRRLFGELGVSTRPTEMSMSIADDRTGLEYAGGTGVRGVFAQPHRIRDRWFWSLLWEVRRFHRRADAFLARTGDADQTTLGDFLADEGFSSGFRRLYAVPLVSCVWSTGSTAALDYPAHYLLRFLAHHGMLSVSGSPQWHTVVGGSRRYVDAVSARIGDVRRGRAVTAVTRHADGVTVTDASGSRSQHDRVVVATHADQALGLLTDPSPAEKEVLGAFGYTHSEVVLHTDARVLPQAPAARAAWNFRTSGEDRLPVVTYWMNRLHGIDSTEQYLVTLNAPERIDPGRVLRVLQYSHPVYDLPAVRAQRRLGELATDRTVFAGAYHGWGFHEDGCRAGAQAARAFGVCW